MKHPNKIDYSDYKYLYKMASRYGRSRGLRQEELAADFAQEYCLAVFQGKHRSLVFQFANFLRKYYGRTNGGVRPGTNARSLALRTMKSLDKPGLMFDVIDGQVEGLIYDETPLRTLEKREFIKSVLAKVHALPKKQKMVILLYYFEDLNLIEIGKIFSLTESRISQIHTEAINKLRKSKIE